MTIEPSTCIHWLTGLTKLFPSFWLFLVLFWMLWIMVTVHKPCHVTHKSRITTWRKLFMERPFSVSNEWVRSWSHAYLIAYHKTLTKKLLAVCPEKVTRRKKEKKTRKSITKLFALKANKINLENKPVKSLTKYINCHVKKYAKYSKNMINNFTSYSLAKNDTKTKLWNKEVSKNKKLNKSAKTVQNLSWSNYL